MAQFWCWKWLCSVHLRATSAPKTKVSSQVRTPISCQMPNLRKFTSLFIIECHKISDVKLALEPNENVERVRRCHRNDLDRVLYFWDCIFGIRTSFPIFCRTIICTSSCQFPDNLCSTRISDWRILSNTNVYLCNISVRIKSYHKALTFITLTPLLQISSHHLLHLYHSTACQSNN